MAFSLTATATAAAAAPNRPSQEFVLAKNHRDIIVLPGRRLTGQQSWVKSGHYKFRRNWH